MSGKERGLTDWDIQCMAFHEAGHAVCSYCLPERGQLLRITIDPSDDAFGMIKTARRAHHNETETSLMSTIATFLAGRLAEEKFCGIKSTSCIHDLAAAREIAQDMVGKFGMGRRMKLLSGLSISGNSFALYSEHSRRLFDEDVSEILGNACLVAEGIITRHCACVRSLAALLIERKTLTQTSIQSFFNGQEGTPPAER